MWRYHRDRLGHRAVVSLLLAYAMSESITQCGSMCNISRFEFVTYCIELKSLYRTEVRLLNVQSGHIKFLLLKFFRKLARGMLYVIRSLEKSELGSIEVFHIVKALIKGY
jgi:hypothetical protein